MKLFKKALVSLALIGFTFGLYKSGLVIVTLGISIFILGSLFEFYTLCEKLKIKPIKWLGIIASLGIIYQAYRNKPDGILHVLLLALLFTFLKLVLDKNHLSTAVLDASVTIFGLIYVTLTMSHLILICNLPSTGMPRGIDFFIYIVLCNSLCDMSANGVGSWFGKTRFLFHVSPNKTIVGTFAGISAAIAAAVIVGIFIKFPIIHAVILGFCIGISGIVGDFSESLFKRSVGVKDSGTLFVEHGGMLDRCDSLFLSSFFSYLYLVYVFYK